MNRRTILLSTMLIALGACGGADRDQHAAADSGAAPVATPPRDADVELAIAVYRGIEASPGAVDSVLAAHGVTEAGLDSLMYRIASDSARAAAYTSAIR
jgi:hypothetical protein